MIDFKQRVSNLQTTRDGAHNFLNRTGKDLRPEAIAAKRVEIDEAFTAGLTALNTEFRTQEQTLSTELAAARFNVLMATFTPPETGKAALEIVSQLLPTLTSAQLSELYANAIAAGNIGAQIAVETFKPDFSPEDRSAGAALLEISSLRTAQQAARSKQQSEALAAVESRLKTLRDDYRAATLPLVQQRAADQAQGREPQF